MNTYEHETNFGYILDKKVYLKAFLDQPDKEIGTVKETNEAAIEYFEKKYQLAIQKVQDLQKMIAEAENKGSYLMKLLHLKESLLDFKGIGDFTVLITTLEAEEKVLRVLVANNRSKNFEIKQEIVYTAQAAFEQEDIEDANEIYKELKNRWIKTGLADETSEKTLEAEFNDLFARFIEKRRDFFKKRNEEIKDRLERYKDILDVLFPLRFSKKLEEAAETYKEAQQVWKDVGVVPAIKMKKLWDKFKKVNNEFFFRYKQFKAGVPVDEIKPLFQQENVRDRMDVLCKQAEALIGLNTNEALEDGKKLLIAWKDLSKVYKRLDETFSNRFRNACDRIFEEGYLIKLVKRKYPDFDDKPKIDQFRIKTSFMRELLRKDEMELRVAESTFHSEISELERGAKEYAIATQKRKLGVKKQILAEFEVSLKAL